MKAIEVSIEEARRLALEGALLGGPRPTLDRQGILDVVRRLAGLQIDPTRTVERTHLLVLWSRLGAFDRSELDRLLWKERRLLEYNAFIVPVERLPELRFEMAHWATGAGAWQKRLREWLIANDAFRKSILARLRSAGPLPSRAIDPAALKTDWKSSGWTHGRSATRMLEFMSAAGQIMVSGRQGNERLWDLTERVLPANAPAHELSAEEYAERRAEALVRRFGVAATSEVNRRIQYVPLADVRAALERLVERGAVRRAQLVIDGGRGQSVWVHPDAVRAIEARAPARTTFLSPFDQLINDRDRTERLFDFRYRLEMYVPKKERQFGHFALPILHAERLVGRLDSEMDHRSGVLTVNAVHLEPGAPRSKTATQAVDKAIADLAGFLGASQVRR